MSFRNGKKFFCAGILFLMAILAVGTVALAVDSDGVNDGSYGLMRIEKKVVGLNKENTPKEFSFTLTGVIEGDEIVETSKGSSEVKNDGKGDEIGSVTVTENTEAAEVEGYTLTPKIDSVVTQAVYGTSSTTMVLEDGTDLVIEKMNADSGRYLYTITNGEGYTQTLTVEPGKTAKLTNIPKGTYTITEEEGIGRGFDLEVSEKNSYTTKGGETSYSVKLVENSTLTVSKPETETGDDWAYKFTITGPSRASTTQTVTLKPGESTELMNIETTGMYTITEYTPAENYDLTTSDLTLLKKSIVSVPSGLFNNERAGFTPPGDWNLVYFGGVTSPTINSVVVDLNYTDPSGNSQTHSITVPLDGEYYSSNSLGYAANKFYYANVKADPEDLESFKLYCIAYEYEEETVSSPFGDEIEVTTGETGELTIAVPQNTTGQESVYSYVITDENGAEIAAKTLKDGEKWKNDLDPNTTYFVAGTVEAGSTPGFTCEFTYPEPISGRAADDSESFYAGQVVMIRKNDDPDGTDQRSYTFEIKDDTSNHNVVDRVILRAGEAKQVSNLTLGEYYTVTEVDTGYTATFTKENAQPTVWATTEAIPTLIFTNIYTPLQGSYKYVHEYYYKDAGGNLTLEGTSEIGNSDSYKLPHNTQYTSANVTKVNTFKVNGVEYPYEYFRDAYGTTTGSSYTEDASKTYVTATKDSDQIIILKYVRESAGSYKYVHEYYKDDGDKLTLEGKSDIASSATNLELDNTKHYDEHNVTKVPEYGDNKYTYKSAAYGTMTVGGDSPYTPDSEKQYVVATKEGSEIIILKYVRKVKPGTGTYKYVHEYYYKDADGNLTLEGTSEIRNSGSYELPSNTQYTSADVTKVNTFKVNGVEYPYEYFDDAYGTTTGSSYTEDASKTYVTATSVGNQIIILKYVREGSYKYVHEYYYKDADGNLTLEGKSDIGSSAADLEKHYDERNVTKVPEYGNNKYTYDSAAYGTMTGDEDSPYAADPAMEYVVSTEDGKEIIILRYVRSDKEQPENGSYRVVHEYYFRDLDGEMSLEGVSDITLVSGLPLDGTEYDADGVTRRPNFGENIYTHFEDAYGTMNGGNYSPDGAMEYVIATEDGEQIIILRYLRAPRPTTPPPPELPDPNDPDTPDEITIIEDDVPKSYLKVWDPEEEEWFWVPEDDVPLANMEIPETGNSFGLWALLAAASLAGVTALTIVERKKK